MITDIHPLAITTLLAIIKRKFNKEYQKEDILKITIFSREFCISMNNNRVYSISIRTFVQYNDLRELLLL